MPRARVLEAILKDQTLPNELRSELNTLALLQN